jgi:hypothetical protein
MALWIAGAVSLRHPRLPYFNLRHTGFAPEAFSVDFSFYLDQLSLVMLLVVTGVGFLIHIYSVGYMWEDDGYYRFISLPEPVHVLHADAGAGEQLPADVHRLGGRGPGVVSADRLLVH